MRLINERYDKAASRATSWGWTLIPPRVLMRRLLALRDRRCPSAVRGGQTMERIQPDTESNRIK